MAKENHGIISVSRVMSNCLGGSFAKENEFVDVTISGELISVAFTTDATTDLINDVTKDMREFN